MTYIHKIYSNGLLKLKKWIIFLFMLLYTCIFVYEFFWGYIIGTQYMTREKKNICAKKNLEKKKPKKHYGLLNGLK